MKNVEINSLRIGVIGLGYVGLPLAVEFSKKFPTLGFDINEKRVAELKAGRDSTQEVAKEDLNATEYLSFTTDIDLLRECNFYIISVPTPINTAKQPDLSPLISASTSLGRILKGGDYVVFESTVYPGATEEVCVPILEHESKLTYLCDEKTPLKTNGFYVGYSPERINPGDKEHSITNIIKVTSGSTPQAAAFIDSVYREVIKAGTYLVDSIRVAEAAKVIENIQRDVNIALINELAILFTQLGIDTESVLQAAETKWNFLSFRPGLVGGHCIGVDPYYLTHKAQQEGYHPEIILAGRRINDGIGTYIAQRLIKAMIQKNILITNSRVLIMGLSFKENCPDIRNTGVVNIVRTIEENGASVDVYDPLVNAEEAVQGYDIKLVANPKQGSYDAIVLAVAHQQFVDLGVEGVKAFGRDPCVVFDVKYLFPAGSTDLRL